VDRAKNTVVATAVGVVAVATAALGTPVHAERTWSPPPPVDAGADYQLGGDAPLPTGVSVVVRDWFSGRPVPDPAYSICYVNAFQTQPDEAGVRRPDETSHWPDRLVLTDLGDDPNWPGEYLIDISTPSRRAAAARHVSRMVERCAARGYEAVEFDNLDSWTRFDGTSREDDVPFARRAAVRYAAMLTDHAHSVGLAVAQKNTPQLSARTSRRVIGFDFAVVEECGRYRECDAYRRVFDERIIAIEYTDRGFERACRAMGDDVSVIRRDLDLGTPDSDGYRYQAC
jgi:hypothetical protein